MADIFSIATGILAVISAVKHGIEAVKRAKGAYKEQEELLCELEVFESTVREVERNFEGDVEPVQKCLCQSRTLLENMHALSIRLLKSDGSRGFQAHINAVQYRQIMRGCRQTLQVLRQELTLATSTASLAMQRSSSQALLQMSSSMQEVLVGTGTVESMLRNGIQILSHLLESQRRSVHRVAVIHDELVSILIAPMALSHHTIFVNDQNTRLKWLASLESGSSLQFTALDDTMDDSFTLKVDVDRSLYDMLLDRQLLHDVMAQLDLGEVKSKLEQTSEMCGYAADYEEATIGKTQCRSGTQYMCFEVSNQLPQANWKLLRSVPQYRIEVQGSPGAPMLGRLQITRSSRLRPGGPQSLSKHYSWGADERRA